jgi:uncharacterized protein (DUF488 family)
VVRIFTVGHGTRSVAELIEVLDSARVGIVADVRRFPGSRRHPQFGRSSLEEVLPIHSIAYEWWGEELGGRRASAGRPSRHPALVNAGFRNFADHMDTPQFRTALQEFERKAGAGPPVAIMCAETLWWRCHRRMIADALTLDGVEVIHLLDARSRQQHRLHTAVRSDDAGRPVYDVGALALD